MRGRLTRAVAGFAGLMLAGFIAMVAWSLWDQRAQTVADARRAAENLARTLEEISARTGTVIDLALDDIAEKLAMSPGAQPGDPAVHVTLRRQAEAAPQIRSIIVLDRQGRLGHSSDSAAPAAVDLSDRAYFRVHLEGTAPPDRPYVGRPQIARDDGKPFIPMSRRIAAPDGRFDGVVAAVVDPEYFRGFFGSIEIGPHGRIALWNTDAVVLSAHPASSGAIGDSHAGGPIARARAAGRPEGVIEIDSPADGGPGLLAYRTVPNMPLVVSVSLAATDYLRMWRWTAVKHAVAATLIAVAMTGMALLLIRLTAQAEAASGALERSESRLRDFADSASDWFWEQDENLRFTFVSASNAVYSGMTPHAHLGMTRRETRPLGVGDEQWRRHDEDLAARRPFRGFRFQRRDAAGHIRHLAVSGKPVFGADGRFLGYRGTGRDVTAEVEAETARRSVESRLQTALANMTHGISIFGPDGRLVLANERYIELFNLPREQVRPGLTLRELMEISVGVGNYPPAGADAAIAERLAIAASGTRHTFVKSLAGGRRIEVIHAPLPDGGFVATYADVTERERTTAELRAAKEQAEAANLAKTRFLSNMSHELRTPLNAIIGFADVMSAGIFGRLGAPKYEQYARDIRDSGRHLLRLIDDVLDLSKIEAGRYELDEEEVELGAIARAVAAMLQPLAQSGNVTIQVQAPPAVPAVRADARAMKQILINLVSNAIKFSPAGGAVVVSVREEADRGVALRVADTGIGIRPELLERIFEPFQRGDAQVRRQFQGAGLGLAISRRYADLHGGSLTVESEPGRGTTVTVRLPAWRALPEPRLLRQGA